MIVKIIATAVVMVFNFITRKLFLEKRTKRKEKKEEGVYMKTYSNDEIKDIRKKKEKKSNIIRIIIMALLIVLEIIFILLLINKTQFKNDEIGLFGGKVYIINDNSMNPELNRDDIIILKGVNERN